MPRSLSLPPNTAAPAQQCPAPPGLASPTEITPPAKPLRADPIHPLCRPPGPTQPQGTIFTPGLGRVSRAAARWPGSRSNSSRASASRQGISFISNTACSMLLSRLPASHCSKCDTSHHPPTKTRSGVSSHRPRAVPRHPTNHSLRERRGRTRPKPPTQAPLQGSSPQQCTWAPSSMPCPTSVHVWMSSPDLYLGAEEDFKLQPPFLITLPHGKAPAALSKPSCGILFSTCTAQF